MNLYENRKVCAHFYGYLIGGTLKSYTQTLNDLRTTPVTSGANHLLGTSVAAHDGAVQRQKGK